jgi:hypothetical protein
VPRGNRENTLVVFESSGGVAIQETVVTVGFVQEIFESFKVVRFGKGA